MRVPDEVRKTVGFICYEDKRNQDIIPVGSFFFFGHDPRDGETFARGMYSVTARHVIDGLRRKGVQEAILRLNPKNFNAPLITIRAPLENWFSHPNDNSIDVAVTEMGIPAEADHLVLPFSLAATERVFKDNEVELGEEVFISGLFRHHFGNRRNIPIVRVGNLAALDEEKIDDEIECYLVEARSTGGLSGSPVFLNLGVIRNIGGEVKHLKGSTTSIHLLGLVHGHFLEKRKGEKPAGEAGDHPATDDINAGIIIVIPIKGVIAVIAEYERKSAA
jgi:hypothetical protein